MFYGDVKKHVRAAGLMVRSVYPFTGAVKKVARPSNCFSITLGGKDVLVKMIDQAVSGSASEKVPSFYLNLGGAPYDKVYIVLNDKAVDAFEPWLDFFKRTGMPTDKVAVISVDTFKALV